jgi:hypothetical protein
MSRAANISCIVLAVELQGVGALQAAFEKLKQELARGRACLRAERKAFPAPLSATRRPGHVAHRRGHPRRAACHATPQSRSGNHPRPLPRAGRRARRAEIAEAIRLLNEFSAGDEAQSKIVK